jgi:Zn-dependent alcohol dehydrogenase
VLIGCCVPTGFGSAVNTAQVRAGDTVVVLGVGGIGSTAIQGAKAAGARHVVAMDPIAYKRDRAVDFGATHTTATVGEAQSVLAELTRGQLADACIITTDVAESAYVGQALSLVGKRGRVVVTAIDIRLNCPSADHYSS